MSMAETMTREDKEKWLLRPLQWAWQTCIAAVIFIALIGHDGKADAQSLLVIASAALAVVTCLLLWGIMRITAVVKRY